MTFVGTIPAEIQPPTFFAGALTQCGARGGGGGVHCSASSLRREAEPVIRKAGLTPLSER